MAFQNCAALTLAGKLPHCLRTIMDDAFMDCDALAGGLVLPPTVVEVGGNALRYTGLTTVRLPAGCRYNPVYDEKCDLLPDQPHPPCPGCGVKYPSFPDGCVVRICTLIYGDGPSI
jgi:hypothetical protein